MAHKQKSVKYIFLAVLLIKLHVLIINLARKLFFTEEKMLLTDLLKQFLKSMIIVKTDKKSFLIRILLCLKKKKVIVTGYVINYLMLEMIK